jgi:hypothetical protein
MRVADSLPVVVWGFEAHASQSRAIRNSV